LCEYYDIFLLDKLLIGIDNVDILHSLVNEPFFASSSFVAISILKVLESSNVECGLIGKDVAFPILNDLDLCCWHKVASSAMKPLND
jgi:hypothetical protein